MYLAGIRRDIRDKDFGSFNKENLVEPLDLDKFTQREYGD